jgi:hypothetical protein
MVLIVELPKIYMLLRFDGQNETLAIFEWLKMDFPPII